MEGQYQRGERKLGIFGVEKTYNLIQSIHICFFFFGRGVGQLGSSGMIVHINDFVRRLLLQTKQHRLRRTKVTWNMCQLRTDLTFFLFEFNLEIDKKNLSNPENAILLSTCEPNGHLTSTDRQNLRAQGVRLINPPKTSVKCL